MQTNGSKLEIMELTELEKIIKLSCFKLYFFKSRISIFKAEISYISYLVYNNLSN